MTSEDAHVSVYVHGTQEDNEAPLAAQIIYIELKPPEYFGTQVKRLEILRIKA